MSKLTISQIKSLFVLDRTDWVFRYPSQPGAPPGRIAGKAARNGTRTIKIDGTPYPATVLVWAVVYGEFPKFELVYNNGNKGDNNPRNLRRHNLLKELTHYSLYDMHEGSVPGVTWNRREKVWRVRVRIHGCQHQIGAYDEKSDAILALQKWHAINEPPTAALR